MKREMFDIFFGRIVTPIAEKLCEKNTGIKYLPDTISGVYEEYTNQNLLLKDLYMDKGDNEVLDRHKVAACMIVSIIKNRVITLKPNAYASCTLEEMPRANEQLALSVGLSIIRGFILEDSFEKNDDVRHEYFDREFIFPSVNHGDYESNLIRALFYSNIMNNLNVPFLSKVLFDIEHIHELNCKIMEYEKKK